MNNLPEQPQSANAQLRQLPAYQPLLAPAPALEPIATTTSRVVAALMQAKDTAAILLLLSDGSLIFGIICLFGIPGLILYGLRWRQVRGQAGRGAVISQAVLSLLHELFWTCAFYGVKATSDGPAYPEVLTLLYGLGALLSLGQLLLTISGTAAEDASVASPSEEHLAE